jgi:hypothetical protein
MCLSAPNVPTPPTRQAPVAPTASDVIDRSDERLRRRLALGASILTSADGLGTPASTTQGAKPVLG